MIVYGPSVSPFVRKVLVFAAEKGIEVQNPPGLGPTPDPGFLEASPFRKIPAFRDGDFTLADSSAIVAYLEKVKPQPELIPSEAKSHARTIWYDEFGDTILCAAGVPIFFNRLMATRLGRTPDLAAADRAEAEALPPVLDYLERVIPASGWLVDDRLTLADISVASPFVNLLHLGISPKAASHPKLAAYVDKMLALPSFARLISGEQAFFKAA
jgi:glutathione S-transferase